jgi:tetratricopeptide (TPR) repeat protein
MHFGRAKGLSPDTWRTRVDDSLAAMFNRHFERGVMASKRSAPAEAVVEYRLANVAAPENFQGYYARAAALLSLARAAATTDKSASEQMYSAALEDLDKVIQLNPGETEKLVATYQAKSEALYRLGDPKGADEANRKAVELATEAYKTPLTIHPYRWRQDPPSVVDSLAQSLSDSLSTRERFDRITADDADAYNHLAGLYSRQRRWEQALRAYQRALELRPDGEESLYNLVVMHYLAGTAAQKEARPDSGRTHYERCIELGRQLTSLNAGRPEYWQVCGHCRRGIGDSTGARHDLKRFNELRNAR